MSWASLSSISWSARASSWTAKFQEWNGTAGSRTLRIDKPRLRRGQEDKETLAPILESILRVRVKDDSRFIHNKLQTTDYENFRLLIQKGGSDWGSYVLFKKDGGDQIAYDNPILKLRFEGGLRRLKKQGWGEEFRLELLRIFQIILSETRAQFPVRVYMRWANQGSNLSSKGHSQAIQLPAGDLARDIQGESYFDVLKELLISFNLQIVQYAGKWHIMQRVYRNQSMTWEQRTMGGSESTGTFDPRTTQSKSKLSEWEDKFPQGRNREDIPSIKQKLQYQKEGFSNAFFTDTYQHDNDTYFKHWWTNPTSIPKFIITGPSNKPAIEANDGLTTANPGFLEQSHDQPFTNSAKVNVSADVASLSLEAIIVTKANSSNSTSVVPRVFELIARKKVDGTLTKWWWDDPNGWEQVQKYIKSQSVPVPSTGTTRTTVNFNNLPNIPAPPSNTRWELLIRCVCDNDPDRDGTDEVDQVEFFEVDVSLQKNSNSPSGEIFHVGSEDNAEVTRSTTIGAWDLENQVSGVVRYWNGSEWDKGLDWTRDGNSFREQNREAVLGIESQINHDLAELEGAVANDGVSVIESPKVDGVRYIPSHTDEILTHERRYMEFVEYKNS